MKKTEMLNSGSVRQKRWRERRKAEGKKILTLTLSREAKEILEMEKERTGDTLSVIIDRALMNRKKHEIDEDSISHSGRSLEVQNKRESFDFKKGEKKHQNENGERIKIRHSEKIFRVFFETASDLMAMTDKDGYLVYMNESMAKSLGYSREEMIGMHVTQVLYRKFRGKRFRRVSNDLIKKGKLSLETIWVTKSGEAIYGEEKLVAIYDSDGSFQGIGGVLRDITQRKLAEKALKKRDKELRTRTRDLQELNTALRVLLGYREKDKTELEDKVLSNVKLLINTYIERLSKSGLNSTQQNYLNILESNLKEIISPFARSLSSKYRNLTPTEIKIANLVKIGRTTKEIAELLTVSEKTVAVHRENIRRKLGIKKKNRNLRSHLLSFQ